MGLLEIMDLNNMHCNRNYYILNKPISNFWTVLLSIIKFPFSLPRWIVSFLLSRNFTLIALNPNQIKTQKPIHVVFVSNDKTDKGAVIVNVLPQESFKTLKDYLLIFSSSIIKLPFISNILKRQLKYDDPDDKAYIDQVIEEIDLLLEGNSKSDKCTDKKFEMSDIHIKGLESLDSSLYAYFHEQLYKKYGRDFIEQPRKIKLDFYTLETHDRSVLDSVAVSTKGEHNKPISERKFVIACMARDQNYINWIKDFNYSAQSIGCTVIGFNYRGIDYSKGMVWTQENMINDALAQAQRLLDLGAKPENIGYEGMSIGGAVATLTAARLHERGIRVKLYNERSFRSLPRLISGYLMPDSKSNLWNPINWLRYAFAGFVFIVLAPILWLIGWHMDAASAWDKIPEADKDYAVVRDLTNPNPQKQIDDGIIHDSWASIASLIDEHKISLINKEKHGEYLTAEEQELLNDRSEQHYFKGAAHNTEHSNTPLHHIPRRFLVKTTDPSVQLPDHMVNSFINKLGRVINNSYVEEAAGSGIHYNALKPA